DSTRSTFTGCRKSWGPASPRNAPRPKMGSRSGKTTSILRSSTRNGRAAARGRARRAGVHGIDEGSAADHPLSHARPHTASATDCAEHAAHGESHRPLGRHADHPRRERVSVEVEELILKTAGLSPHYVLEV